jgi:hypothetical protein
MHGHPNAYSGARRMHFPWSTSVMTMNAVQCLTFRLTDPESAIQRASRPHNQSHMTNIDSNLGTLEQGPDHRKHLPLVLICSNPPPVRIIPDRILRCGRI